MASREEALSIKVADFPGVTEGFELAARFCYNNGRVLLCPSNFPLLHCAVVFLEMTVEVCPGAGGGLHERALLLDLGRRAHRGQELRAVRRRGRASGLLERLISLLFSKITASPDPRDAHRRRRRGDAEPLLVVVLLVAKQCTVGFGRSSSTNTPESMRPCAGKEWWFDDLTSLYMQTIEKVMRVLGCYGIENKNLKLTWFLLHYLRAATHRPALLLCNCKEATLVGLVDMAVHGVALVGGTTFSCWGLFWVLGIVSTWG